MNKFEQNDIYQLTRLRMMDHHEYAAGFPEIDTALIGKKIGEGKGHVVYTYDTDRVIKFPKIRSLNPILIPTPTARVKQWELETIKSNFPNSYLETEVLSTSQHPFFCMVQRRLGSFENLSSTNIHLVEDQLRELLATNMSLVNSIQASVDFLGEEGLKKSATFLIKRLLRFRMTGVPEISNVVVENNSGQHKLAITDISMIRFGTQYWGSSVNQQRARRVSLEVYRINQKIIKKCFDLDI